MHIRIVEFTASPEDSVDMVTKSLRILMDTPAAPQPTLPDGHDILDHGTYTQLPLLSSASPTRKLPVIEEQSNSLLHPVMALVAILVYLMPVYAILRIFLPEV